MRSVTFSGSATNGGVKWRTQRREPGTRPPAASLARQTSAGPASRILFASAPTSRAPRARREIAGFRPGFWLQGPVERTLAHSEPHARSGLASQLRGLASNPAVNRLRAILSGRVSGGVADERTMPVGRTAFGNHKAATGGFGSL